MKLWFFSDDVTKRVLTVAKSISNQSVLLTTPLMKIFNSLSYIQFLAELEEVYNLEFPDEWLGVSSDINLKLIIDYLKEIT